MVLPLEMEKPGSNGSNGKLHKHEPTLADYITIFLRGKWIILGSLVLVLGATMIYTFTVSPVYESDSLVLIDMKGANGSLPFPVDITGAATLNKVTNELEILKSNSMAQAVALKLLEKKTLPPNNRTRIPIIEFLAEDDSSLVIGSPEEIMERLHKVIDFSPIRESDIIKISARSTNPREAALLANVYAESYVERNLTTSRTRSRSVREFLQAQREARKRALDTTETALQAYMHSSGTVSLDDETKKIVEQLSQLEANRDAIQVEISSREKTLNSYKEELARQEPAVARSIGESNDSYVRLLQEQLAKLEVQRDVMIAQNPQMAGQRLYLDKLDETSKQIASLKEKLQSRTSEFMKSLVPSLPGEGSAAYLAQTQQKIIEQQIELEGLSARERALSGVISEYEQQFDRIPQKSLDLARLQRSRLSSEKLYLLIEEKYNEAAITEKSEFGYVDIIDPALSPTKPVSPRVAPNMILAVLVGLGLGIVVVLGREHLNVRIWTPDDLKRFGFNSVSTVGRMVGSLQTHRAAPSGKNGHGLLDPHLITVHAPVSSLAESYRHLRTNVQFAQLGHPLRSVLVTSANPSEGKTTTVSNLATTFAQAGKKVLLVDADMRRPNVHILFNLHRYPGLSDYIVGSATYQEVVHENVFSSLDIICSGTQHPNPSEIPGSPNMKMFFKSVAQMYDLILLDSPPLLAATDASVLSTEVDGTVLVVAHNDTHVQEIEDAVEALHCVGASIICAVLNNFDLRTAYGGYTRLSGKRYGYGHYQAEERMVVEPDKRGRRSWLR